MTRKQRKTVVLLCAAIIGAGIFLRINLGWYYSGGTSVAYLTQRRYALWFLIGAVIAFAVGAVCVKALARRRSNCRMAPFAVSFAVCLLSPLAGTLYTGQRGCLLALAAATVGNAALWGGILALLVQYRRQAAAGLILKILAGICAVLFAFCFIPIRFCVTSLSATESHPCYIVQGDRIIGDKNGLYTDAAERVAAFSDATRGERLDWNLNRTLSWDVLNHPDTQFLVYGEAEITEQVDQSGERVLVYRFDTLEWDLYGIVASEDPLRAFFPRTYLIAYDYFWFDYLRDVAFGYRDGMAYCY